MLSVDCWGLCAEPSNWFLIQMIPGCDITRNKACPCLFYSCLRNPLITSPLVSNYTFKIVCYLVQCPLGSLQLFLQFKLTCSCWVEARCRALAHQAAPNLHVSTWTLPMSVASFGPNSGNGLVISREGTSTQIWTCIADRCTMDCNGDYKKWWWHFWILWLGTFNWQRCKTTFPRVCLVLCYSYMLVDSWSANRFLYQVNWSRLLGCRTPPTSG